MVSLILKEYTNFSGRSFQNIPFLNGFYRDFFFFNVHKRDMCFFFSYQIVNKSWNKEIS